MNAISKQMSEPQNVLIDFHFILAIIFIAGIRILEISRRKNKKSFHRRCSRLKDFFDFAR
jgi:hypothetical protein